MLKIFKQPILSPTPEQPQPQMLGMPGQPAPQGNLAAQPAPQMNNEVPVQEAQQPGLPQPAGAGQGPTTASDLALHS
jgi:hypothetical protein